MSRMLPRWDRDGTEKLKPFSHIRLIIADLDGTVLNPHAYEVFSTIKFLSKNLKHPRYGVGFTIATGRAYAGVHRLLQYLALPRNCPIILYNGSLIIRSGTRQVLHKAVIPGNVIGSILDVCLKYLTKVLVYYYDENVLVMEGSMNVGETIKGWTNADRTEVDFNGIHIKWQISRESISKSDPSAIVVDVKRLSIDDQDHLYSQLETIGSISATRSGSNFIEIRPSNSNKATALRTLAELLEIDRKEILALGDNDNDKEMLAWAGIGVAVEGASRSAINNSRYKCNYDAAMGTVELLRLVKEARRYYYSP